MLNRVEPEKSFITSGPDQPPRFAATEHSWHYFDMSSKRVAIFERVNAGFDRTLLLL